MTGTRSGKLRMGEVGSDERERAGSVLLEELPKDGGSKRSFGRFAPTRLADRTPMPLPRDQSGNQQSRTYLCGTPVPRQGGLRKEYAAALDAVERYLPLHAARLRDLVDRAESSLEQFHTLRQEEEERFACCNEEARRHDECVDRQISEFREERDALAQPFDQETHKWQEELRSARVELAIAKADAGIKVDLSSGVLDITDEGAESEEQESADTDADSTSATSVIGRIGAFFRRLTPEKQESADKGDGHPASPQADDEPLGVSPDGVFEDGPKAPDILSLAAALDLVPSREAFACIESIPYRCASGGSMRALMHGTLGVLSLIAVGMIFGLSLAFITDLVPSLTAIASMPWHVAVCGVLGIAMFWTMGRVVSLLAGSASEGFHSAALAANLHAWLRRAAIVTLVLLVVVGIGLVFIEASVEKHGVIGTLFQRKMNAIILTQGKANMPTMPSDITIWMMVLCVSLPYILFHTSEGWLQSRHKTLEAHLDGKRHEAAWKLVEKSRLAHDAFVEKESQYAESRYDSQAAAGENVSNETVLTSEDLLPPPLNSETPQFGLPSNADPDLLRRLASCREHVLHAYQKLREARAKRQETTAWHDSRMAMLEASRTQEHQEQDLLGRRREEDAYADFIGAVRAFDEEYRKVKECLEYLPRPSLLRRLFTAVVGNSLRSSVRS